MKSKSSAYGNSVALKAGKTADLKGQDIRKRTFMRKFLKTASPQTTILLVDGKRPQVVENPNLAKFGIELEGASMRISNERPALKGNEGRKVVLLSANKDFIKEVSKLKDNADVNTMDLSNNAFLVAITFRPSTTKPVISFIQVDDQDVGHMLTYSGRSYSNFLNAAELLLEKGVIEEMPDISIDKSIQRDPRPSGVRLGNMGVSPETNKTPVTKPAKVPPATTTVEAPEAEVEIEETPVQESKPVKGPLSLDDLPAYVPKEKRADGKAPPTSKLRPKPVKVAKKAPSFKDILQLISESKTTADALEEMNEHTIKKNSDCRKALIAALQVENVSDSTLNRIANMEGNVARGFAEFSAKDIQEYITPEMLYIVEDTDGIKTLIEDLDDLDSVSGYERGYVFWLLLYTAYDDVADYIDGLREADTVLTNLEFLQMAANYGMLEQDQADEIEDLLEA